MGNRCITFLAIERTCRYLCRKWLKKDTYHELHGHSHISHAQCGPATWQWMNLGKTQNDLKCFTGVRWHLAVTRLGAAGRGNAAALRAHSLGSRPWGSWSRWSRQGKLRPWVWWMWSIATTELWNDMKRTQILLMDKILPQLGWLKHSVHNYVMKLDILPYQLLQAFVHSIQDIMFPPWKSRECKTWTSKPSCDASTCLDDNPGFEIFARWSSRGQCCPRPGRVPGLERFSYEDMLRLGFVMKCHEYHWISNRYYRIWQNIK